MYPSWQSTSVCDCAIEPCDDPVPYGAGHHRAKALKEHFILERIAEDEQIEATSEDYDMEIKLKHNLATLSKLEEELRKQYDDEEIFEQLELHKKSLSFYIERKEFTKGMRESDEIIKFIIPYLTD